MLIEIFSLYIHITVFVPYIFLYIFEVSLSEPHINGTNVCEIYTVNLEILAEKILKLLTCWRKLILAIASSLKIDIHSRLPSSHDVEPLPFTLPYLQKSASSPIRRSSEHSFSLASERAPCHMHTDIGAWIWPRALVTFDLTLTAYSWRLNLAF